MIELTLPNGDRLELRETWGDHSDLCEAWFAEGDALAASLKRNRRVSRWTQWKLAFRSVTAPARRVLAG